MCTRQDADKKFGNILKNAVELVAHEPDLSRGPGTGHLIWDVDAETMIWTDDLYRLHDLAPGDIPPGSKELIERGLQCYEAEDRSIILAAFNRCAENGESYDLEFLFTTVKGNRIWIRTTGEAVMEVGKVAKVVGTLMDITERKAAETALQESEAILGSIFRSAPIGIGLVVNRVFQQINTQFCEMVGYTAGELLRKSSRMVYPTDEDFQRVGKEKYTQISKIGVGSVETRFRQKDGEIINVLLSSAAIDPDNISRGAVFMATDLTEEKAMVAKLAEKERYYRSIIDNLNEQVLVLNSDYTVVDVNELAVAKSGLIREAIIGHKCYGVSHGYDRPCDQMGESCVLTSVFSTGTAKSDRHQHVRTDGLRSWVDIEFSPLLDSSGQTVLVIESMRDVTDLIEIQESLRESEAFNRSIISSSQDSTKVLDADGNILFVSEGGQRLLEIDDIAAYVGTPWLSSWTGTEFELAHVALESARNGEIGAFQGSRSTLSGVSRWWDVVISPISDESDRLLVVSRDITDQREQQTTLRRQAAAIDQVDESIVITDLSGKILYINPAFERITGYMQVEVVGRNSRILKSGKHEPSFYEDIWEQLTSGKVWKGHFINRRKNGELFDEEASISPVFGANGEISQFVAVKRDVSRELENEKQLRIAQKMEAIGTLAGGIAHDFNNILSSIIGFSELARDAAVPGSRQYEHITDVLGAGKRAADLVRQILTVSRRSDQYYGAIRIGPVVHEAMILIRASFPATIQICERVVPDLPIVIADSTQIHQVVMNLCTNAHHAMRERGGILTVELDELMVEESSTELSAGPYLRLQVHDTGPGIEPNIRERIFDPYFTTKDLQEGTGLGLSVVHGIVREHHGQVSVHSEPGRGTTFTMLLPIAGSDSIQTRMENEPVVPAGDERVLLVDDEEPIARMLEELLEGLGYTVTVRTNSLDTLAVFIADPDQYDLVITDMTMPKMTGDKLCTKIREIRPDIPVVICTGFSEKLGQQLANRLKINALVMKPIDRTTLARTIRDVLDKG